MMASAPMRWAMAASARAAMAGRSGQPGSPSSSGQMGQAGQKPPMPGGASLGSLGSSPSGPLPWMRVDLSGIDAGGQGAALYRLPPRVREPLIQGMQEKGPEAYQRLIDAYYRQLTKENK